MRLTNLVALLVSTNEPLTLEQIRQTIEYPDGETGRQAFIRDRNTLRDEGIEIAMTYPEGLGGGVAAYRIESDAYYLPELDLSDEEQIALNLAFASMRLDAGWGQQAAWKLGLSHADTPVLASIPTADGLPKLFEALRTRAPAEFSYRGRPRQVHIYGLLCREGFWYAIGHDVEADAPRTFRVDRIEKGGRVKVAAPNAYRVPDDFDASAAMPTDPKQIGGDELVVVTIEVDDLLAAKAVAEAGPEATTEPMQDGGVRISMPIANRDAFRSWLLGFGDRATLIGPPEIRQAFVRWLESIEAA